MAKVKVRRRKKRDEKGRFTQLTLDNKGIASEDRRLSGRALALKALDDAAASRGVQEALREAFVSALKENPIQSFQKFIMPLIPKEHMISVDPEQQLRFHVIHTHKQQGDKHGSRKRNHGVQSSSDND